jgi:hypothetical protein
MFPMDASGHSWVESGTTIEEPNRNAQLPAFTSAEGIRFSYCSTKLATEGNESFASFLSRIEFLDAT